MARDSSSEDRSSPDSSSEEGSSPDSPSHDDSLRGVDPFADLAALDWRPLAVDLALGPRTQRQRLLYGALPLALVGVSFSGYATDVFEVATESLALYPDVAALLGVATSLAIGVAARGWLLAAVATYASALGYQLALVVTDTGRASVASQVQFLFRFDIHFYYVVVAALLAFWPFVVGSVVGEAYSRLFES